jgi:nucleoporin POM152
VLHGTPPFNIHYTTQRNGEKPRALSRVISSSRDEIVLQPESSGSYSYRFTHISDQNYKDIKLEGGNLSINQVVHPLASADFVRRNTGAKRPGSAPEKLGQTLGSCSGSGVDVDVELKVSTIWTMVSKNLTFPLGNEGNSSLDS